MKTRYLALAGIVAVLIGLATAVTTTRPAPAPTFRCSKVSVEGDNVLVIFAVSNRTSQLYGLSPVRLEHCEGTQWGGVPDGIASFSRSGDFGVRGHGAIACLVKRIPPGTRLRLVFESQKERKGLDSFLTRARIRFAGDWRVSLNPFHKVLTFTDPVEVVTEEFLAP